MAHLIDSNVAIHWRDDNAEMIARIVELGGLPDISVLTRVELEGGAHMRPTQLLIRQARWAKLVATLTVHDVNTEIATAYAKLCPPSASPARASSTA